jgi:hypothetical protein
LITTLLWHDDGTRHARTGPRSTGRPRYRYRRPAVAGDPGGLAGADRAVARTVAFESAFAALRHFRLIIGSAEPDDPLSAAAAQLMQVTAMACGVAFLSPNQLLLSQEERIATGETLRDEIDATFASLRVLERAAKRMIRS